VKAIYLIRNRELVPSAYFSPKFARQYGSAIGWSEVTREALQFVREEDAQMFIDTYLPALAAVCIITRTEGP
jgi:hypothetical protein